MFAKQKSPKNDKLYIFEKRPCYFKYAKSFAKF